MEYQKTVNRPIINDGVNEQITTWFESAMKEGFSRLPKEESIKTLHLINVNTTHAANSWLNHLYTIGSQTAPLTIIFLNQETHQFISTFLRHDVKGIINEDTVTEKEIHRAYHLIKGGYYYLSPKYHSPLLTSYKHTIIMHNLVQIGDNLFLDKNSLRQIVSKREIEIITEVITNPNANDVHKKLFIASTTLKNHLTTIYKKLKVDHKTHMVSLLLRRGWLRVWHKQKK